MPLSHFSCSICVSVTHLLLSGLLIICDVLERGVNGSVCHAHCIFALKLKEWEWRSGQGRVTQQLEVEVEPELHSWNNSKFWEVTGRRKSLHGLVPAWASIKLSFVWEHTHHLFCFNSLGLVILAVFSKPGYLDSVFRHVSSQLRSHRLRFSSLKKCVQ